MQSDCLMNRLKVKASAEHVRLWYKHKLADVYAIHWCQLHQWLSVTRQSSTASVRLYITAHLLSTAESFSRFYSHSDLALYLARRILRSHVQYAIEICSS